MPITQIVFYQENGDVPVLAWIGRFVQRGDEKAAARCYAQLEILRQKGYDLRRPYADYLESGIYELRISYKTQNLRILYTFVGKNIVLLTNAFAKEKKVPKEEIALALERKAAFEAEPEKRAFYFNPGASSNDVR